MFVIIFCSCFFISQEAEKFVENKGGEHSPQHSIGAASGSMRSSGYRSGAHSLQDGVPALFYTHTHTHTHPVRLRYSLATLWLCARKQRRACTTSCRLALDHCRSPPFFVRRDFDRWSINLIRVLWLWYGARSDTYFYVDFAMLLIRPGFRIYLTIPCQRVDEPQKLTFWWSIFGSYCSRGHPSSLGL